MPEQQQLCFRVPPALAKGLRSQAKSERRTVSAVLAYLIEQYIKQAKEQPHEKT